MEKICNTIDKSVNCREGSAIILDQFNASMEIIVSALQEKGYDPYAQLFGYLQENNPVYITQHQNARSLIQTLDKKQIEQYIAKMK